MPLLTLLRPRGTPAPVIAPVGAVQIPSLRVRLFYWPSPTSSIPTVVDLSDRCVAVGTQRGRSSRTSAAADPGTMTLTFDDTDGLLDPENTSSSLSGRITPSRSSPTMFMVEHLFEGSYRPLGTGMLDSIERSWGGGGAAWSQTVVTTVDQTADLAGMVPPAGILLPQQSASDRINLLRQQIPSRTGRLWQQRALIQGVAVQSSERLLGAVVTDGETSLWDYLSAAAFADDGLIYFTASGALKFQAGSLRLDNMTTAILGDHDNETHVQSGLTYRQSADDVIDEAAFTTAAGNWTGAQSASGFYASADGTGTATALADRYEVESRARYVYARDSVPRRAVESVTLDVLAAYRNLGSASPYRVGTGISLSDRVQLNRRPPGGGSVLTATYHVESISHSIEAGRSWTTTLRLSKAPAARTFWRLGVTPLNQIEAMTW